ncbi:trihelix transcription factor GT-3b-like [Zingiber officinale]|uniref:trihelix transcription factor GT-3b-like n=1 Tax=Zingiber officinale TaxID=94328 RepID=UPI001C4CD724|nr:trihelix transcription factor GT-3b-like [Zingiber officinale]
MMLGGGGGDDPFGCRMAMLAVGFQPNPPAAEMLSTSGGGERRMSYPARGKEDRVLQWSQQETRDLIAVRAKLEQGFPAARGNKTLWEAVAAAMRERGYFRTPDQCKCKWKNLTNRYKTANPEARHQQCPFYDELHAVFAEQAKNTRRLLDESESGASQSNKRLKKVTGERFVDELSGEGENENSSDGERLPKRERKKSGSRAAARKSMDKAGAAGLEEVLRELLQQQRRMDAEWLAAAKRRAEERRAMEQELREAIGRLERERVMLETAQREREEQRRAREESRAEKREALLASLLDKLVKDDD